MSRPELIFQGEKLTAMVFKGNNSDNDDLFVYDFNSGQFRNLTETPDNEKVFEISQENGLFRIETRTLYHQSVYQMNLKNAQIILLEKEPIIRDPEWMPREWNAVTLNSIIAFGDSITVGEMRMDDLDGELHPELAYLAKVNELLEEYGETYPINLGISGSNTYQAVERMDRDFSANPAYFCLILYGTNDVGWNLFSAASSAENLEWICLNARGKFGMYPIISTIPPAKLWEPGVQVFIEETEALNARIINLATRNNIPYINTYQAFFNHPDGWEACLEDIKGNHPSPLGHEIMAGLFAPKILELPPAQPRNINEVANTPNYIMVQWSENLEFDFDTCRVEYGFQPDVMNRIARSTGNYIKFLNFPFDPYLNHKIYFRIQAMDLDGNTSAFTPVISIEFDR
jgi:lysophospholipase L1-like esterase